MNKNLSIELAKHRQYIIVTDGFDYDGTLKYVIRKVLSASFIKVDNETVWCVNFLEPIEKDCTGVCEKNIIAYTSTGRVYPDRVNNLPDFNRNEHNSKLTSKRMQLKRIAKILVKDLESCKEKICKYMEKENLGKYETLINEVERHISISSYCSDDNLVKALNICAKFNKYHMCVMASSYRLKHSVRMDFQF